MVRSILAALVAVVLGAVSTAFLSRSRQSSEGPGQLWEGLQRGEALEDGRQDALWREQDRRRVAEELSAGKMSLLEATDRFRFLNEMAPPSVLANLRRTYPDCASDRERHGRRVLLYVKDHLAASPRRDEIVARLEREFEAQQPGVRLDSGVSGHIHPALCVTKKRTLLVAYCHAEYKPHRLTRSTDGGKSWSKPILMPHSDKVQVYPGSLTVLADGRIVHAWNVWFTPSEKVRSRHVAFSISSDDGLTWSEPVELAKNKDAAVHSVIRHPLVELAPTAWLVPLMDRTIVYNPRTKEEKPFGDGRAHGLVPIVRTVKGTLVSGKGLRSADGGKSWQTVKPFPDVSSQGWRHEMLALDNGWLIASQIPGPGGGGARVQFVVSRDDGRSWDVDHPIDFYDPGRPIGGRACPRTVQLDDRTLGTVFYDTDPKQDGGSGLFFKKTPLTRLEKR